MFVGIFSTWNEIDNKERDPDLDIKEFENYDLKSINPDEFNLDDYN